jgi:hypothetical protein
MSHWSRNPRIYQINTWVWLTTLSEKYNEKIMLHNVPEAELDKLASYHVDAVWLMGVWFRGKTTRASALNYIHEYVGALPDVSEQDVIGSAYAIADYRVDEGIGGRDGLLTFRQQLHARGLKLVLDFVPNHTGLDHRWLHDHPEYYVNGTKTWYKKARGEFFLVEKEVPEKDMIEAAQADNEHLVPERDATHKQGASVLKPPPEHESSVIAHGRDPYFPGWIDTAQLSAFSPGYRQAAVETLLSIAELADGVRCDMAMLMMNEIFVRTWGWLGLNHAPNADFWTSIIPQVKAQHPNFLFIAETYWNMEYALLQQGFDYTYDKTMYDRLLEGDTNAIYKHLNADYNFLRRQIRFIENHDEKRANDTFGLERSRAAAILICTTPGATLLHDGQFTGRIIKLPVHISRQTYEREYTHLHRFYMRLLQEASHDIYQHGEWKLFNTWSACEGCIGEYNFIAYGWRHNGDMRLIVLNFSGQWSQARVDLWHWGDSLREHNWRMTNVIHSTPSYQDIDGTAAVEDGLIIDMESYQAMIYHFTPIKERIQAEAEFTEYAT